MQGQYRLRRRNHFTHVYRRGKSVSNRHMVLLFVPGRWVQVGISVSKKLGNAVRRNKVKRRIRECVRPYLEGLRPGRYVIVAREAASGAEYRQLAASLRNLLDRGGYIRTRPA